MVVVTVVMVIMMVLMVVVVIMLDFSFQWSVSLLCFFIT